MPYLDDELYDLRLRLWTGAGGEGESEGVDLAATRARALELALEQVQATNLPGSAQAMMRKSCRVRPPRIQSKSAGNCCCALLSWLQSYGGA